MLIKIITNKIQTDLTCLTHLVIKLKSFVNVILSKDDREIKDIMFHFIK